MSVWLLSSPYGRSDFWPCVSVCRFIACMCMCCVCMCVCRRACACVSPLLWITSVYALHVCVLYVRPGAALSLSPGVFLLLHVCECVCAVTLAAVVRLHDSRYSYGVLLCADAWPLWESVSVSVWSDCVCVCVCSVTLSLWECFWPQLASTGDVAQRTRCTFPVVDIWYYLVYDFSECTCL